MDPFGDLEEWTARWERLLRRSANRDAETGGSSASDWMPTVDIMEDDSEYLVKVELPEVQKEDVRVTVQEGVLTISGQRMQQEEDKKRKFHRLERTYGTFARSFTLPADAAEDQMSAEFKNGVLRVRIAKLKRPEPKAIDVKVA
jgi:HSP20 family protein